MVTTGSFDLSEALERRGLLTRDGTLEVVEVAQREAISFHDALIQHGYLTEQELDFCLSEELGIPQVLLSPDMVDPDLVKEYPADILRLRTMVPVIMVDGEVTVAMGNPLDGDAVRDLERASPYRIRPAVAEGSRIQMTLDAILGTEDQQVVGWSAKAIEILTTAFTAGATEVHIEPVPAGTRIRRRIRGRLLESELHRSDSLVPLLDRFRALARMPEHVGPGQGRFRVNLGGVGVDVELSILPTPQGDSAVLLYSTAWRYAPRLKYWPLEERLVDGMRGALARPGGLIVVNSPRAEHRRALGYALLAETDAESHKVLTLESAAFRHLPEWTQVEEGNLPVPDRDRALELLLKQRPDAILLEGPADWALPMALPAVLEGVRVIIDTPYIDAADVLLHLRALKLPPPLLDRTLRMVLSVAALPGLCPSCRQQTEEDEEGDPGFESYGCEACDGTGERGEILVPGLFAPGPGALRRLYKESDDSALLTIIGRAGHQTIRRTARRYVRLGRISAAVAKELL
jgi:type II secretory ATPase GspE/PulE/Tfp pilus assembly ATPase PilB-like protein